ncbi:MAG: hypothetical protein EBS86_07410 [Crocinitomicaceae bacterium]|nr:hypothetical protein [Crocinitomicaceae bacterium]
MDKSKLLTLFKENLVKFFDALIEQFPKEGDFILLRLLCDQLPSSLIINTFAARILPYTDLIKKRDEKFFLDLSANVGFSLNKSYEIGLLYPAKQVKLHFGVGLKFSYQLKKD